MNTLKSLKIAISALALFALPLAAEAGEQEELLKLRSTTEGLIKRLVKQGILSQEDAREMMQQAEAEAETQVAQKKVAGAPVENPGEVRVTYVPDFVKDEIREEVRAELRQDVTGDVISKAKDEGWGLPDALPEWTRKFKLSGDIRLRSENVFMASDNITTGYYLNPQAINQAGGFTDAGLDAFQNTTDDNHRFRERFRLGITADVVEGVTAGVRLSTGDIREPVSTNQTLGRTGGRYEFGVDRAYLEYDGKDSAGFNWLTLAGGRIKNPFFVGGGEFSSGSELVWDTDLSFEGFYATGRYNLGNTNNLGDGARVLYATAGGFPLQEAPFSNNDKWLLGGQIGLDWGFENKDNLKVGVAYYDYQKIRADQNSTPSGTCDLNTRENDASMPEFMQYGNTLATICREGSPSNPGAFPGMLGLAADYSIVNVTARYDMAFFDPINLILSVDYAENVGFDAAKTAALHGVPVDANTSAWQLRADVGWLKLDRKGNWSTFVAYKSIGRDAVMDAFNDSDFHLGGTNAKGWILGANYTLMNNVWLTSRWLTTDVIDGPTWGVDVFQFDVNTKF